MPCTADDEQSSQEEHCDLKNSPVASPFKEHRITVVSRTRIHDQRYKSGQREDVEEQTIKGIATSQQAFEEIDRCCGNQRAVNCAVCTPQ